MFRRITQAAALISCAALVALGAAACGDSGDEGTDPELARAVLDAQRDVLGPYREVTLCQDEQCLIDNADDLADATDEATDEVEAALEDAEDSCFTETAEIALRAFRAQRSVARRAAEGDVEGVYDAGTRAQDLTIEVTEKNIECGGEDDVASTFATASLPVQRAGQKIQDCQDYSCLSEAGADLEESAENAQEQLRGVRDEANACGQEVLDIAIEAFAHYEDAGVAAQEGDIDGAADEIRDGLEAEEEALQAASACVEE